MIHFISFCSQRRVLLKNKILMSFLLENNVNINVAVRTALLTPCGVEFPVITDLACGLIPF